jgi:hypothetical protein
LLRLADLGTRGTTLGPLFLAPAFRLLLGAPGVLASASLESVRSPHRAVYPRDRGSRKIMRISSARLPA